MPPPGFDALIARKYDILQQHANAATTEADANANLTNVKAGLLPTESAADVAKTQAETAGQNINNRFLPDVLRANIFETRARGQLSTSSALNTDVQSTIAKRSLMPASTLFNGFGMTGGTGSYGGFGFSDY
jgi:hypothetical protein